jgi:hypothetical protein
MCVWTAKLRFVPEILTIFALFRRRESQGSPFKLTPEGIKRSDKVAPTKSKAARGLRWPVKPGFGKIDITLNSAQDLVVDGLFVAQFDYGVTFCL